MIEEADVDNLRSRIEGLETMVSSLQASLAEATGPLQRVFVAQVESDNTWQEKTRVAGDWEDFARLCDDDTHASKAIDLDAGQWCLLEMDDGTDKRYVKISGAGNQSFWAAITSGYGTGGYSFGELEPDGAGGLQSMTGGRSGTVFDPDGRKDLLVDDMVRVEQFGVDGSDTPVYTIVGDQPHTLFPVLLSDTGGGDGAVGSPNTYTYTVSNLNSFTLKKNAAGADATGMSPVMQRPDGTAIPGTRGMAYYETDGTLVLLWADEVPKMTICYEAP